jgi:hypothetical protein
MFWNYILNITQPWSSGYKNIFIEKSTDSDTFILYSGRQKIDLTLLDGDNKYDF